MKIEYDEVKREHDKILAQAWEKQKEVERLDAEIKDKSAQLTAINDHLNKIRQRLG
jgi:hypothetical protein